MRIVSMLLVLSMLLGFAACTKNPDPAETTAPGDTTAATEPLETEDPLLNDNLPDETFNNESIDIWLGYNRYMVGINPDPEIEGDVVSEAANERNKAVEDRFDVVLNYMSGAEGENNADRYKALESGILAGDEFDLAHHISTYMTPRMIAGCFINVANNEILDFEKPWWFDFVIDRLRINDRLYGVSGWFNYNTVTGSTVMYYNIDMAEDYNVGDLYQMVRDGEWTYEKMMEIAESVAEDVNNDGIYDDNDRYGLCGKQDIWLHQIYTSGYSYFTSNEDGTITLTGINQRLTDVFETINGKIFNANWYQNFYPYGGTNRPTAEMYTEFNKDRILFMLAQLSASGNEVMRNGGKFGILPTPKHFDEQEYGAATPPAIACVPVTTGDLRTTSIILEALNAEAYKIIRPAYFEIALSYKYVNDSSSREMLDLALSNLYCDFGYMYMDCCKIGREIPMALTRADNLASWFAAYTVKTEAGVKTLVDTIMALPE